MFSPNEFNGYNGANNNNNQSMILGVHDLPHQQRGNQMMASQQALQQQQSRQQQSQQQSQAFWNQTSAQQTPLPQLALFNILQDSGMSSPVLDMPRKRSRLDTPCETPRNVTSYSGLDGFTDENYSQQQAIRFSKFQEDQWNPLFDVNAHVLQQLQVHVVADKGFNYSHSDNCFVNQKKNHFQVNHKFQFFPQIYSSGVCQRGSL